MKLVYNIYIYIYIYIYTHINTLINITVLYVIRRRAISKINKATINMCIFFIMIKFLHNNALNIDILYY